MAIGGLPSHASKPERTRTLKVRSNHDFRKDVARIRAQFNKLANFFWTADPIAQMQYEYDSAVEELKSGRQGLEQYRALVERVSRQAETDKRHVDESGGQDQGVSEGR